MEFQQNFPVDKLIPYARNSRTHNDEQVAQIMASIKEFGFTNPILIGSDNVIIAGHGRFLAAQRLGMTEVPVIVLPDLTETQRRALVIADNRIALNAGWDEKMLALEIGELKDEDFDLTNLGFTDDELKALENFGEIQDTGNTEDDEVPEAPVEPTSKHGDVWQLGNHRLMCGDTTMIDDFKKLMQNDVADMIFTDPPYNVNYGATMKDKLRYHTSPNHGRTIMNDNLGEDFEQFLYDACTNMLMYCKGAAYVCMSSSELHTLYSAFVKAGGKWSTFIIWAKNTFTLGRADYQRQYEPNVIPDPRENCVARCHLKVGAERIEFFRGTAADGSYLTYINFGKNCYFLIEQASQELYQKILHLFPGDMITLEVFFDKQHKPIVKDVIIEKSTEVYDLWEFFNG